MLAREFKDWRMRSDLEAGVISIPGIRSSRATRRRNSGSHFAFLPEKKSEVFLLVIFVPTRDQLYQVVSYPRNTG